MFEMLPGIMLGAGGILARILGLVLVMPLLSHRAIPMRARGALVVHLTMVLMFAFGLPSAETAGGPLGWFVYMAPEFLLGLALGMMVRVIFAAAEGAGMVVSYGLGLGFATFVDPATGGQSTAIGRFLGVLALLVFVATDAHLEVLAAFFQSYRVVPLGQASNIVAAGAEVASLGGQYFELSLRLAAPVLAAGLMIYVVMAAMTRVAPQLNLFAVGFAVLIPAGLAVLLSQVPDIAAVFNDAFMVLPERMRAFLATGRMP
jgi:flagellar biosynthetic protein FliR